MQKRRARCMATWMQEIQGNPDVDCVFLFGMEPLITVPERQGHCLFLPCPDAYEFLPQRTRWFCHWAVDQGYERIWKLDDDNRVDVKRLLDYDVGNSDYIGNAMHNNARPPQRYRGWTASPEQIALGTDLYASGPGYYLSQRAARVIAERMTTHSGPEDLLVGKTLEMAGIQLIIERERFHVLAKHGEEPGQDNNWVYASPGAREDS